MMWTKVNETTRESLAPLRVFYVRMEKAAFKRFEQQMLKFAEAFAFENKTKQSSPDPYDIFFIFTRIDIDLSGVNSSEKNQPDLTFAVGFYPKWTGPLPPPENVNVLVEGLMAHLSNVSGVVITETTAPKR